METFFDIIRTPFGPFAAAINASGAIVATAFGDQQALAARMAHRPPGRREAGPLGGLRAQLDEYCLGSRSNFTLPLEPAGTAFQHRVWRALAAIPHGETRSYADIARAIGSSPRAVGRANALNPICLLVPCHRVIGADGTLTGYAFGTDLKLRLLAHEGWRAPE
jgi:methylated-DNA-[protein]-cysteine S-methyltransferase